MKSKHEEDSGFTAMIGIGMPEDVEEGGGKKGRLKKRKVAAAEDVLTAVKDDDAEGLATAMSALMRTCRLEERSDSDSEEE